MDLRSFYLRGLDSRVSVLAEYSPDFAVQRDIIGKLENSFWWGQSARVRQELIKDNVCNRTAEPAVQKKLLLRWGPNPRETWYLGLFFCPIVTLMSDHFTEKIVSLLLEYSLKMSRIIKSLPQTRILKSPPEPNPSNIPQQSLFSSFPINFLLT